MVKHVLPFLVLGCGLVGCTTLDRSAASPLPARPSSEDSAADPLGATILHVLGEARQAATTWSDSAHAMLNTFDPVCAEPRPSPTSVAGPSWFERVWARTASFWALLGAYILAPLTVELLKELLGPRRRGKRVPAASR